MVSQNSPAALQRQMQNTRGNLSEHANTAVKKAQMEFDWRHYVVNHPWTSLGAAAALGFFLVPRRTCCKAGNSEAVTDAVDRVARAAQPSPFAGIVAGVLSAVTATIAREGLALVTSSLKQLMDPRSESLPGTLADTEERREIDYGTGRRPRDLPIVEGVDS
jgi:hypothetical protein